MARKISMRQAINEALDQEMTRDPSVIVMGEDIVGGAGGMTGSNRVAKAAPDGYMFVLGSVGTHAQNQTLYKHPLYNVEIDFTPVAFVGSVPVMLAVLPLFGALVARLPRRRFIPLVYRFFGVNVVLFWLLLRLGD